MTPEAKEQLEELKRYCYSIGLTVKETAFYISVRPVGILYKVGGVLTKSKLENFTEKVKQHGSRTLK
jgi:hypothetical protein